MRRRDAEKHQQTAESKAKDMEEHRVPHKGALLSGSRATWQRPEHYLIAPSGPPFLQEVPTMNPKHAAFCLFSACWLLGAIAHAEDKPAPVAMKSAKDLIKKQQPPVIRKELEAAINPDNSHVLVSIGKQRAYLMMGDDVYIDTPISSGKRPGMTPTGSFKVQQKEKDHHSTLYGDFVDGKGRVVRAGVSTKVDSAPSGTRYVGASMKWFCRLNGAVGMHVGILPGYPASHGCVRLPAQIAPMIYDKVKVGTPVDIVPE
jgi:lipoprotein-anchoring transpeptidase ErfK/SrfK